MQPENSLPPADGRPLRITYLTSGAAGMICGSCLNDNTLAKAFIALRHDVQLVPFYTPIRTDEENISHRELFFGGINVYLQQKAPLLRLVPRWLDRWLDNPRLVEWASGRSVKINPHEVADLAISVLRGSHGHQRKEVERLIAWLSEGERPDVIVLSNVLTAGWVPEFKRRIDVPVVVTLQGDDVFLRGLPPAHESQALSLIRELAHSIDLFLVHSRFYADAMSEYLGLDRSRVRIVPLGINTSDFETLVPKLRDMPVPPTIGYLARLAPEKGLDVLAEAFIRLRSLPGMGAARLRIAGWLGDTHRPFAERVFARLRSVGLGDAFEFLGEVDRRAKLEFLKSLDLLAVPTIYRDPKGLFALEAMAAGVPVVLPDHGAFPELLADTQGGLLHRPEDPTHLAERMHELLSRPDVWNQIASTGHRNVLSRRNAIATARATESVMWEVVRQHARTNSDRLTLG
jgi:glycosyltransferase involved in cell wall biosynthesis